MHIDALLAIESKCHELPFPPTFRGVSMLLTLIPSNVHILICLFFLLVQSGAIEHGNASSIQ